MYIESLELTEFRCFEHAHVSFQYMGKGRGAKKTSGPALPNVNLILGDNGTGKSAILKGITLGVLGRIIQSTGFRPYYLVRRIGEDRRREHNASIVVKMRLHGQDSEVLSANWDTVLSGLTTGQTVISRRGDAEMITSVAHVDERKWGPLFEDNSPAFFMTAYGASRRVESPDSFDASVRERSRAPRYQRVANIFEEAVNLTPLNIWLSESRSRERTEEGIELLNALLPQGVRAQRGAKVAEALFTVRGTPLPFAVLSDGYRAFVGWIVDLLHQINMVTDLPHRLTDVSGVVIVDELDLLLHPAWQRIVIEKLATTFPRLQFFFTTHSPIVAGTLESANIILTEIDLESGLPTIETSNERLHGLSADQVLNSRYFGLASSRAPSAEKQLRELAERAWQDDEQAAVEYLRLLAQGFDGAAEAEIDKEHETGARCFRDPLPYNTIGTQRKNRRTQIHLAN